MQFSEGSFYHIFNRGNNSQTIFFQERNYRYFLDKLKKYIAPNANILAWCLMPNHFHILVKAHAESLKTVKEKPVKINALTEGIRLLLSTYTLGIQKQESIKGSLFQQKTKFKNADSYLTAVFHYIHQNPLRAGLIKRLEDYQWSSFQEYLCESTQSISNPATAYQFLNLDKEQFIIDSYGVIPDEVLRVIES
jgi:REP element-mobilizing transposase RayT